MTSAHEGKAPSLLVGGAVGVTLLMVAAATHPAVTSATAWLDLLAGVALGVAGAALLALRSPGRGALLVVAGFLWFAGTTWPTLDGLVGPVLVVSALLVGPRTADRWRVARIATAVVATVAGLPSLTLSGWCDLMVSTAVLLLTGRPGRLVATVPLAGLYLVSATAKLSGPMPAPEVARLFQWYVLLVVCLAGSETWWQWHLRPRRVAVVTQVVLTRNDDDVRSALARSLGDPGLRVLRVPRGTSLSERSLVVEVAGADLFVVESKVLAAERRLTEPVRRTLSLLLENRRLDAELARQVTELQYSSRRLLAAEDLARAEVERQLDGGVIHHLEAVAALVRRHQDSADPKVRGRARITCEHVELAIRDVRRLGAGLPPDRLGETGLEAAVMALGADLGTDLDLDIGAEVAALPASVLVTAWFVCAEAVTNAVKHASAASIHIAISSDVTTLLVRVDDDGVGGADAAGSGLRGLDARVCGAGGSLLVRSPLGRGTTLEVRLPR